jgi:predicted nuclease with TOPRIM domain
MSEPISSDGPWDDCATPDYAIVLLKKEVERLRAEVERLRASKDDWAATATHFRKKLKAAEAEVEQLKAERDALKSERIDLRLRISELEFQIERLKLLVYAPLGDNHHNALECPYCQQRAAGTKP